MRTKRFRLEKSTRAIGDANGKRVAVRIPAGAIVQVLANPSVGNRMVDVLWEGRRVVIYAVDLKRRGIDHP